MMTPAQRHRQGILDRDGPACWFARRPCTPCRGPIQAAHWIAVSVLKREITTPLDLAVADSRNGVAACEFHHGQFDGRFLTVGRSMVPHHVEQFAAEYGLTWRLDRDHPTTESTTTRGDDDDRN